MNFKPYESYEDITPMDEDYILSVADATCISDIPLDDINSFLEGLDEYYEESDGQPDWAQEWEDFGECYE